MHAPGQGKRAQRPWQHPHRPPERAAPAAGTTGTEAAYRLKDPRRPASLMHACIVMSLMAGVRPEEAQAIGWGRTSTWTATLPRSRCCADRPEETRSPEVAPRASAGADGYGSAPRMARGSGGRSGPGGFFEQGRRGGGTGLLGQAVGARYDGATEHLRVAFVGR